MTAENQARLVYEVYGTQERLRRPKQVHYGRPHSICTSLNGCYYRLCLCSPNLLISSLHAGHSYEHAGEYDSFYRSMLAKATMVLRKACAFWALLTLGKEQCC